MAESLTTRMCRAISAMIRSHPEEVCADDIVGSLLTTVAAYGKAAIGTEKTLRQLAVQMAMVADKDLDRMQVAVDNTKNAVEAEKANPNAALLNGLFNKMGGISGLDS